MQQDISQARFSLFRHLLQYPLYNIQKASNGNTAVLQLDFEILRTIAMFITISSGHSLIIKLIFMPFEAFCILYRGYCNRCRKRLNRANLTKKEFKELRDVFLDSTLHEGDSLYWSKPEEVERFKKFLQEHNKFDVVIDSLNVV
jgi:hypothetical protein